MTEVPKVVPMARCKLYGMDLFQHPNHSVVKATFRSEPPLRKKRSILAQTFRLAFFLCRENLNPNPETRNPKTPKPKTPKPKNPKT